jgi:peptidoglycan/xylan/chitin deacetylase (PgdA/CDA1 family)
MKQQGINMRYWKLLVLSCLLSGATYAAGPAVVAKVNSQLWQAPINTPDSFDKASRAAMLLYALSLQHQQSLSDAEMKAAFNIKTVNRASVMKWINKELALTVRNYQAAAKSCTSDDWTCVDAVNSTADLLTKAAAWQTKIPVSSSAWQDNFAQFAQTYTTEQARLAALFPATSSEIDFFNANEWNGDDFADRQFLLTFDDGPTKVQGDTDTVLTMLAAQQKSAVFFVIGKNFQNRLHKTDASTIATLYQHQCVAVHGWEHQSHAKWANWQDSVKRTRSLVASNAPESFSPLFRPPYGQRRADSGAFFQQQGLQVVLWNLDAQDWNRQMNSDDIVPRMLSLMLIKRHGVLLFHDILPKANAALPILFHELGSAVVWRDCHTL